MDYEVVYGVKPVRRGAVVRDHCRSALRRSCSELWSDQCCPRKLKGSGNVYNTSDLHVYDLGTFVTFSGFLHVFPFHFSTVLVRIRTVIVKVSRKR